MLQKTPCKRASELAVLLKQCNSLQTFKQVHTQLLKNSIHAPNFLLSKIIDLKNLPYATLLFAQNPHPNDFSYNVMIRGLSTTWGEFGLAFEFFRRMKYSDQKPNKYTYPFVLIACGSLPCLDSGRMIHSSVWKAGLDSVGHIQHSLITMYARCGELSAARKVFDEIAERDVVSWNSLISGHARLGLAAEAVELFGRMKEKGFVPDEMTLVSVLNACGDLGDAELGRWIEVFVEENKMELSTYIVSSLIGMHAKCGDFESARRIFDRMLSREVVVWNAMITG